MLHDTVAAQCGAGNRVHPIAERAATPRRLFCLLATSYTAALLVHALVIDSLPPSYAFISWVVCFGCVPGFLLGAMQRRLRETVICSLCGMVGLAVNPPLLFVVALLLLAILVIPMIVYIPWGIIGGVRLQSWSGWIVSLLDHVVKEIIAAYTLLARADPSFLTWMVYWVIGLAVIALFSVVMFRRTRGARSVLVYAAILITVAPYLLVVPSSGAVRTIALLLMWIAAASTMYAGPLLAIADSIDAGTTRRL